MKKRILKNIKLLVTIAIVLLFVWFLIVSPMITFKQNEKKLEDAARHYYEINSNQLPTGERLKTLKLSTLYRQSYIKGDLYIPYTTKTCSIENSWVKVRRENGEYRYYTYLECGILSSTVDHKGPEIQLKGSDEITVDIGEKFKDPGVRSVVDNVDGTMKSTDVTVNSDVDTSKIGTYEITYTAYDSLNNKTVVTRTVKVVKKLLSTVKGDLGDTTNYIGEPDNNYVRLSGMEFRIFGIDADKNIVLVADEDVANVNFTKIDKWLDYYYEHLNEGTKKLIIKKKYCNMTLTDTTLDTTQCNQYTDERYVYIPSVIEINKAEQAGKNFMKTYTMSWTANAKSKKEAYLTRNLFFDQDRGKSFVAYGVDANYGVRPMLTISGEALVTGGDGSFLNPYVFGDLKKAKGGTPVNERFTGEYLTIGGDLYRIVDTENDGTTRVIGYFTVGDSEENVYCLANPSDDKIVYDPKNVSSVAYYINNQVGSYIDTSVFVNHEVSVPIYKNKIIYGEEVETKKIKVKLSAPNMYEMFAAQPQVNGECLSYWLINSSKADRTTGAIANLGVPVTDVSAYTPMYIRVVGYIKKNMVISSGDGTFDSPYTIK